MDNSVSYKTNSIQKEADKFTDSLIFEGMTSISAIINSAAHNDRRIEKILYDKNKNKSNYRKIEFLKHKADELGFALEATDSEHIESLTIGSSHGGIIAYCTPRTLHSLGQAQLTESGFYVMLEGIEDPYNFGYALRSLYAAGASGIILTPRNWMSAAGVVCRASAGASEYLPMFIDTDCNSAEIMKSLNYKIVCAGIRNSVSFYDADLKKPLFLIIGGEKRGISSSTLSAADQIIRIDYASDFSGSLSAASCAAILGFEVMHQNKIAENFT